jgi:tetratricopeptide (TPR) repeat protein
MMDKLQKNARLLLICLILALVTLTVFWNLNYADFVNLDDRVYVTENSHVRSGITFEGIRWAFSTSYAEFWHPLTWLSLMLDYELYGLKPGGYHLTNLLLHIANMLLLFLAFDRMTKALWPSVFVAALFALHPLHVESAAWVAERKDVLSAFFWMLTLCAYIYYTEKPALHRYIIALLCFALGLMSKPMLVTLPFVMILLDYWPLQRLYLPKATPNSPEVAPKSGGHKRREKASPKNPWKKNITAHADPPPLTSGPLPFSLLGSLREKIPFFILSVLFSVIAYYTQHRVPMETFPLASRIGNALISYVVYMENTLWPHNLAVFYPFPELLPLWKTAGAAALLLFISVGVIAATRRLPYLFVGWFWYAGTLFPVSGILQVGKHALADRYTYLPLIGLFIMAAWGIPELLKKWRYRQPALFLSAALVLTGLLVITQVQVGYWRDSVTLFRHALQVTKDNELVRNNLGNALFLRGELKEAEFHLREALRIDPLLAEAHYNLGNVLSSQSKPDEAIVHFQEALRIKSNYEEARNNLGMALRNKGNISEAVSHFREVLRINPNDGDAHNNIGSVFFTQGRIREAEFHLREALRINPREAKVHYNMGIVLSSQGRIDEAIAHLREAIGLKPDYIEAHYNLANSLASQGMFDEAISHFREVLRLNPNDEKAHNNMGLALLIGGKVDEAIAHFREALRINPDLTMVKENLQDALRLQGKTRGQEKQQGSKG